MHKLNLGYPPSYSQRLFPEIKTKQLYDAPHLVRGLYNLHGGQSWGDGLAPQRQPHRPLHQPAPSGSPSPPASLGGGGGGGEQLLGDAAGVDARLARLGAADA